MKKKSRKNLKYQGWQILKFLCCFLSFIFCYLNLIFLNQICHSIGNFFIKRLITINNQGCQKSQKFHIFYLHIKDHFDHSLL